MYSSFARLYILVPFFLVCLLVCCFFVLFFVFVFFLFVLFFYIFYLHECSTPFHGKIRAVHSYMLNIVTARRAQK